MTVVARLGALLLLLLALPAAAHESRPAYLQLRQLDAERYDVVWKVPAIGEARRLPLDVAFPDDAVAGPVRDVFTGSASVREWQVRRTGGLDGQPIRIRGLEATLIDVLVRIERLDGTSATLRIVPAAPAATLPVRQRTADVARAYLQLGIEHILGGIDHLLFVFALLLLVSKRSLLLWTITAFTAAHSLTLAAATLGLVHVPPAPVEASIALSIVFLARELLHRRAGRDTLTQRQPWLVAAAFGLLHGFGFAGALSEVGLPEQAIPLALLFFNVGVELGQLAFIAVVLAAIALLRRLPLRPLPARWAAPAAAYSIGTVAACWTIERVSAF